MYLTSTCFQFCSFVRSLVDANETTTSVVLSSKSVDPARQTARRRTRALLGSITPESKRKRIFSLISSACSLIFFAIVRCERILMRLPIKMLKAYSHQAGAKAKNIKPRAKMVGSKKKIRIRFCSEWALRTFPLVNDKLKVWRS